MQLCKTTVELNLGHLKVICIHEGDESLCYIASYKTLTHFQVTINGKVTSLKRSALYKVQPKYKCT